jgi:hypothetical protein
MYRISDYAADSEQSAYMEGAEDGFWKGYAEGANAATLYIMGWTGAQEPNKVIPEEFKPLGHRYFFVNFAEQESHHG